MSRLLSCFVVALSLTSILANAQDSASLNGVVKDPSGAVVKGARVTLTSQAKGSAQDSRTNGEGLYSFPFVLPGSYTLSVDGGGFKKYERTDIVMQTAQKGTVNANLQIGSAQETVTVTGDRVLLNENDGSVGAVIDRTLVENIPLNGRSLQSLFTLVPGVTQVATGISPDTTAGTIIVNGQRAQSNQFIVDGVSANVGGGLNNSISPNVATINAVGGTQGMVTVDELEEFKVLTSTYSAEYGTSPGGQFILTTRAGTNRLHGSAYEYLRNEDFDANDWFNNNKGYLRGELRQNQFGGTLGGPVTLPHFYDGHNKTFFFAAFEGLKLVTPVTQVTTVPDLALRSAAYPALQPILNAFPVPNGPDLGGGVADYTIQGSQPSTVYTGAVRVDHSFSPSLQSFIRYTRSPSTTSVLDSPTAFNNVDTLVSNQSLTFGLTWVPTSTFGNDLRFNWSTTDSSSGEETRLNQVSLFSYLQRSPDDPTDSGSSIVFELPGGIFSTNQGTAFSTNHQFNFVDTFSWTKGPHSLRFGGNLRRLNTTVSPYTYLASTWFATLDEVQTGVADSLSISSQIRSRPTFYDYGLFVNDDWKISSRLRAQLGLRWDVNPVPGQANGLSPTAYSGYPNFTSVSALPAGSPLYKTRYANFAPRAGVAYKLLQRGSRETVLRLGGGLFYDTNDAQGQAPYASYPFGNSVSYSDIQFPFTAAETAPPSPSVPIGLSYSSIYVVNSNLRLPLTYSWSAAIEQSLGPRSSVSATYVGNAGRQLMQTFYYNYTVQNAHTIVYATNGANSSYNALQLQYQARLLRGMTAFGNYTWSHSIDNTNLEQSTYGTVPVRGTSDGDQPNIARMGLSYTGPEFQGRLSSLLLSEWGTDLNIGIQSGLPFTVSSGYYVVTSQNYQVQRANIVPGVPQWIRSASAPGGWQLNVNAFSAPPAKTEGDLGRNSLRGFPVGQADVAIRKAFNLKGSLKLQARAEAFNITNHPNFGNYNTSYSPTTTTLGQARSMLATALGGLNPLYQTGGPRSMQFALKLLF